MSKLTIFLRKKRIENNMTIEDISKKLNISSGSYSHKERGMSDFKVDELSKLKVILKINNEEIIENFFN